MYFFHYTSYFLPVQDEYIGIINQILLPYTLNYLGIKM